MFPIVKDLKFDKYVQHCKTTSVTLKIFIEKFIDKGYKTDIAMQQIQKVDQLDQKQLLQ